MNVAIKPVPRAIGIGVTAAGLLIQALGGGWNVDELPSAREVTAPPRRS